MSSDARLLPCAAFAHEGFAPFGKYWYTPLMKRRLNFRVFTLVAALVIAAASVVSAARMLPDTSVTPDSAIYYVAGTTIADFCGDAPSSHDHRCPFCQIPADPVAPAPWSQAERLVFTVAWRPLTDLTRTAQRGSRHASVRAPPAQA